MSEKDEVHRQWVTSDGQASVQLRTNQGVLELVYEDAEIEGDDFFQCIQIDSCSSQRLKSVPGGYGEVYGRHATQVATIERVGASGLRERLVIFRDSDDPRGEAETTGWHLGGALV